MCLSVCLSVCLGRISYQTAERIWLKCCTETEVCLGHYVSGDDRPRGRVWLFSPTPARGPARAAENVVFLPSTVLLFGRHYFILHGVSKKTAPFLFLQ